MSSGVDSRPQYPGVSLEGKGGSFRVLALHPGQSGEVVRCSLKTTSFEDAPTYEALSYAWGEATSSYSIWVDDCPVRVGDNLHQALLHLRSNDIERLLWIDALCINQHNIEERNQQVQQMAKIYSEACQVTAWLGLETDDSKDAFEFLRSAYAFSPLNRKSIMNDTGWKALINLCERPYFGRVWIVQEICLARNLVIRCSSSQIPWRYISELRRARKHIWPQYLSQGERAFVQSFPARIDQQRELSGRGNCVLWALMEIFQRSGCKEAHDRVYGFLGLANDYGSQDVSVDYAKPMMELYEDVMKFYHGRFRSSGGSAEAKCPQLVKLSEFLQQLLGIHSTDRIPPQVQDQKKNGQLQVSATAAFYLNSFLSVKDAHKYNAEDLVNFLGQKVPYSHLGTWRDMISPTMSEVHAMNETEAFFYASSHVTVTQEDNPDVAEDRRAFIARRIRSSRSRIPDPALRTQYVVGVAPAGSQVGDIICTFLETKVCLLFRPRPGCSNEKSGDTMLNGVGRAVMDFASENALFKHRARLNADKTLEISVAVSNTADTLAAEMDVPWPVTISLDVPTLQALSTPHSSSREKGFAKTTIDLLPFRQANASIKNQLVSSRQSALETEGSKSGPRASPPVQRVTRDGNKNLAQHVEIFAQDRQLVRHALGPKYAGIINLGATGYLSATLQILFMIRPFRNEVLQAGSPSVSRNILEALSEIFHRLLASSQPVSPRRLTDAFGWEARQLQDAQDFLDFFVQFTDRFSNWKNSEAEAVSKSFYTLFAGQVTTTLVNLGSSIETRASTQAYRTEDYFHLDVWTTASRTLEEALRGYLRVDESAQENAISSGELLPTTITHFEHLPPVLMISLKHFSYDFDKNETITIYNHFTYPKVLRLTDSFYDGGQGSNSDWVYQLHGVVVLEAVEPVPRFLLYLRPRPENQWLLFFNDSVTYAVEEEVHEHNFGAAAGTRPPGAPLRTPTILLYLRMSKLESLLDTE